MINQKNARTMTRPDSLSTFRQLISRNRDKTYPSFLSGVLTGMCVCVCNTDDTAGVLTGMCVCVRNTDDTDTPLSPTLVSRSFTI
jgi:hypothetical protein